MGDKTPDARVRTYADVMREAQLARERDNTLKNIADKRKAEQVRNLVARWFRGGGGCLFAGRCCLPRLWLLLCKVAAAAVPAAVSSEASVLCSCAGLEAVACMQASAFLALPLPYLQEAREAELAALDAVPTKASGMAPAAPPAGSAAATAAAAAAKPGGKRSRWDSSAPIEA